MKVLIDLERTIASGVVFYWNQNRHGYTHNVREAGLFEADEADQIVNDDFDKRTIAIDSKVIDRILKNE